MEPTKAKRTLIRPAYKTLWRQALADAEIVRADLTLARAAHEADQVALDGTRNAFRALNAEYAKSEARRLLLAQVAVSEGLALVAIAIVWLAR